MCWLPAKACHVHSERSKISRFSTLRPQGGRAGRAGRSVLVLTLCPALAEKSATSRAALEWVQVKYRTGRNSRQVTSPRECERPKQAGTTNRTDVADETSSDEMTPENPLEKWRMDGRLLFLSNECFLPCAVGPRSIGDFPQRRVAEVLGVWSLGFAETPDFLMTCEKTVPQNGKIAAFRLARDSTPKSPMASPRCKVRNGQGLRSTVCQENYE